MLDKGDVCLPACHGRPSRMRCRGTNTGAAAERADCIVRRRVAGRETVTSFIGFVLTCIDGVRLTGTTFEVLPCRNLVSKYGMATDCDQIAGQH